MVLSNDDAMNKIPLKSASGLDDEEKNGGEFIRDTAAAEEARREQMRVNLLHWMKKLTIVLICFIGIALICYVIISLCFSDWTKNPHHSNSLLPDDSASLVQAGGNNNATSSIIGAADNNNKNNNTYNNKNMGLKEAWEAAPSSTDANMHGVVTAAPVTLLTTTAASATAATINNNNNSKEREIVKKDNSGRKSETKTSLLQDVPINKDEAFQSKLGVYEKAAVCSDREVCSQIGSNILEQGGTAVDSAIATLLCNGILSMQSMGIGGGMLMNVYIKGNKHAYAIDAREVAPYAANPDMFNKKPELSLHGGLAIAVPGELMGYHRAHERFGKLPWKALIEPSLKLCDDGFYLNLHQWDSLVYKHKYMKNDTLLNKIYVNETTGELHPVGTKLKPAKELCETYALLAKNGPLDFYNGTLARLVVEDLKELGSIITLDDLESYVADLVSSITMQLGDDVLYALPPVSSGTVVANILSVLEGYNFSKADLADAEHEAITVHRFAEAMKFAFAKRWDLGDLRFNDVRELVSQLTNPEYNADIRSQINDTYVRGDMFAYGAQAAGEDEVGTSQTVVLAPNGDAVSVTSSVNDYFGSGQAGKRTGIIFNSGMNDFAIPNVPNQFGLPPTPTNFIDGHKRAMSSMSPLILAKPNGDVRLIIGAAGGSKIISGIAEVAARVLWFGEDIKTAIDAPRFHHQLVPDQLEYQAGMFSEKVIELLKAKGHELKPFNHRGSVVCGIVHNSTAIYANADYRKQGGIAGF